MLLTLLCIISFATGAGAKERYNLNNGWVFGNRMAKQVPFARVNIPHVWSTINTDNAQYVRELIALDSWKNKTIYLKFNAVSSEANLFINGRFVGQHKGASTAFLFDITSFLTYGSKNQITLYVNNNIGFDATPLENIYYNYGGITRDVELIVAETEHIHPNTFGYEGILIKQKEVTDKLANLDVVVEVAGLVGDSLIVKAVVKNDKTIIFQSSTETEIGFSSTGEALIPITIKDPILWNGKINPFLYELEVTVYDSNNKKVDSGEVKFGVRSFKVDPEDGFYLNGKKYPLYGVIINQSKFGIGNGYTKFDIENDFQYILDIGATAVRTSPGPLDKYFYDLCDRHGIIVWCDFPFASSSEYMGKGFVNSYTFVSNGEMQMSEMLHQYNNHPSIAMYGIFNSISSKGDNAIYFIENLNRMVKKFSPDRYTVATSIEDGNINYITDLIGWEQHFGWEKGLLSDFGIWVNSFKNNWQELSPAIASYGSEAIVQHSQFNPNYYKPSSVPISEKGQSLFHESHLNVLNEPNRFWGYFVNSMFDFKSSILDHNGNPTYKNYGLVTFDRSQKKDAYYLYKANWNADDKFTHIANSRIVHKNLGENTIVVYSNCSFVDLIVNSVNLGGHKPINGVVKWTNIKLPKKFNSITVIGDKKYTDSTTLKTENYY